MTCSIVCWKHVTDSWAGHGRLETKTNWHDVGRPGFLVTRHYIIDNAWIMDIMHIWQNVQTKDKWQIQKVTKSKYATSTWNHKYTVSSRHAYIAHIFRLQLFSHFDRLALNDHICTTSTNKQETKELNTTVLIHQKHHSSSSTPNIKTPQLPHKREKYHSVNKKWKILKDKTLQSQYQRVNYHSVNTKSPSWPHCLETQHCNTNVQIPQR